MSEPFNPYEVLGVAPTALEEEIRAAFRREAAKAHPDREGGSTERMTDVNMAWKILSDPEARAQFDRTGGIASKVALEVKARDFLLGLLQVVIRNTPPNEDMLGVVRQGILKQRQGCKEARGKTRSELAMLRDRLRRLKGPPENFVESLLLKEIQKGEAHLPTFDADEEVMGKALEILQQYSYDTSYLQTLQLHGQQGSPFAGLYGVLGSPGG